MNNPARAWVSVSPQTLPFVCGTISPPSATLPPLPHPRPPSPNPSFLRSSTLLPPTTAAAFLTLSHRRCCSQEVTVLLCKRMCCDMGTFRLPACLYACPSACMCLPVCLSDSLPSSAWIKFLFECRQIIVPAPFSGTTSITYLRVAFLTSANRREFGRKQQQQQTWELACRDLHTQTSCTHFAVSSLCKLREVISTPALSGMAVRIHSINI